MEHTCKIGDRLYRKKYLVEHAGCYCGDGDVVHNAPSGGVQRSTFAEFAEGKEVKVSDSKLTEPETLSFLDRVDECLKNPKAYSLMDFNCEHHTSWLLTGTKNSPQLQAVIAGAAIGGLSSRCIDEPTPSKTFLGVLMGILVAIEYQNHTRKYDDIIK